MTEEDKKLIQHMQDKINTYHDLIDLVTEKQNLANKLADILCMLDTDDELRIKFSCGSFNRELRFESRSANKEEWLFAFKNVIECKIEQCDKELNEEITELYKDK